MLGVFFAVFWSIFWSTYIAHMYDLARVSTREPYNLHGLLIGQIFSCSGSVLRYIYRSNPGNMS